MLDKESMSPDCVPSHPGLPRTALVLTLRVPCLRRALSSRNTAAMAFPQLLFTDPDRFPKASASARRSSARQGVVGIVPPACTPLNEETARA